MANALKLTILLVLIASLEGCGDREYLAEGVTEIDVHVTVSDALNQPIGNVEIYLNDITTGDCDAVTLLGRTDNAGRLEVRFPYTWCRPAFHRLWRKDQADLDVAYATLIGSKDGYAPAVARVGRFRLDALVAPVIRQKLVLKTRGTG